MCKYISFGKCNRKYFFILGSIACKFIRTFIYGFTPHLVPKNPIYIFRFESKFFSHPIISLCFQYLSMIIGGIILQIIYNYQNKSSNNIEEEEVEDEEKLNDDLHSDSIILREFKKNKEMKVSYDIKKIILIFGVYFVSQFTTTSLNQIKLNRIKLWSLEPIFLYIFSKKILHRIIYKHQKISIIIIVIFCTVFYFVHSFIPYTNDIKDISDCTLPNGEVICEELKMDVYQNICSELNCYFIPIFIILYLAAIAGNSYSIVSIKWLMDIKYIRLFKIILNVGIVGFVVALGELFIFSYIPCLNNKYSKNICTIKYQGDFYYDNYRTLGFLEADKQLFIDIFVIIPLFLISSFFERFFELLIIINLDPFYLIPIDCTFYFFIEIIDYILTLKEKNPNRDLKLAFMLLSNGLCILFFGIYLEIIELHFCNLDQFLRRYIIKREMEDKNFIQLAEITDDMD